jgi:molybdate transport system substrate-binding protein
VAVAANFNEPAGELAELFKKKTGHKAILITGASGAFYTQITHGVPFEVFLSADEERPRSAIENGFDGGSRIRPHASKARRPLSTQGWRR